MHGIASMLVCGLHIELKSPICVSKLQFQWACYAWDATDPSLGFLKHVVPSPSRVRVWLARLLYPVPTRYMYTCNGAHVHQPCNGAHVHQHCGWRNRDVMTAPTARGLYYACTKWNYVITLYMYMYCIERSVNISIRRIRKRDFVMLLLAMISLYVLNFRLMVTMVADFCSLVILIHNTLQEEITISSTWTTRVNGKIIPLFPSTQWYSPHAKIHFMVIELRWFKKKKKKKNKMLKTWTKFNVEIIFSDIMHILHHNTTNFCILFFFSHILHLDIIKSEINFKLKVKMNKILIYGFQWG